MKQRQAKKIIRSDRSTRPRVEKAITKLKHSRKYYLYTEEDIGSIYLKAAGVVQTWAHNLTHCKYASADHIVSFSESSLRHLLFKVINKMTSYIRQQ